MFRLPSRNSSRLNTLSVIKHHVVIRLYMPTWTWNILQTYKVYRDERSNADCPCLWREFCHRVTISACSILPVIEHVRKRLRLWGILQTVTSMIYRHTLFIHRWMCSSSSISCNCYHKIASTMEAWFSDMVISASCTFISWVFTSLTVSTSLYMHLCQTDQHSGLYVIY